MESLERKEEAGEGMNEFIVKYINLYYNKSITKCVANAIQTSRLFWCIYNIRYISSANALNNLKSV